MNFLKSPRRLRVGIAGMLLALVSTSAIPAANPVSDAARVESLGIAAQHLQRQVDDLGLALNSFAPVPRADIGAEKPILVAQSSRDVASINVRLGQLEEQIRILTGQVEGLQFQMTQMQTLIERMQEDYEFRFQQLEGTPSGKTEAAPQSGSDMLSGGLPQNQDFMSPDSLDLTGPDMLNLEAPETAFDHLVDGDVLGAPERTLGTLSGDDLRLEGQPLDLNFGDGGLVTERDANAQYQAGYDAVVRGDYAFAEDQFRQFIGLFPDHPRAPDATNWLGEALILRGAHDEAADILLTGFQSYPTSQRAPDLLLKLGVALAGAGEHDTACRTFGEVQRRFPNVSASFNARLSDEMGKAQC